jgi:tetratricopeptide (TPR) repeat protein
LHVAHGAAIFEGMSGLGFARLSALFLIAAMGTHIPVSVEAQDSASSATVIVGDANALLADGAAALQAGRVEEGVRLTLEGLKGAVTAQDNAAGHSNACAGYVLLKQWPEALVQCNAALALDTSNWRTYNNRAAIYIQQGLYDLGMQDLRAGLALAPEAATLHESLRILERNKRISGRRTRRTVPS